MIAKLGLKNTRYNARYSLADKNCDGYSGVSVGKKVSLFAWFLYIAAVETINAVLVNGTAIFSFPCPSFAKSMVSLILGTQTIGSSLNVLWSSRSEVENGLRLAPANWGWKG